MAQKAEGRRQKAPVVGLGRHETLTDIHLTWIEICLTRIAIPRKLLTAFCLLLLPSAYSNSTLPTQIHGP